MAHLSCLLPSRRRSAILPLTIILTFILLFRALKPSPRPTVRNYDWHTHPKALAAVQIPLHEDDSRASTADGAVHDHGSDSGDGIERDTIQTTQMHQHQQHHRPIPLPKDYLAPPLRPYCAQRFSTNYLRSISETAFQHCPPESSSPSSLGESLGGITCFHARLGKRNDPFCIFRSSTFSSSKTKFQVPCPTRRVITHGDKKQGHQPLDALAKYWYDTGPGSIVPEFIDLVDGPRPETTSIITSSSSSIAIEDDGNNERSFTIFLKREGPFNPFHSMMELFSLSLTLDALAITPDPSSYSSPDAADAADDTIPVQPYWSPKRDFPNTRVLILDSHPGGPYFDLWRMFAGRGVLRFSDMQGNQGDDKKAAGEEWKKGEEGEEYVIVPLAGASNPLWQGQKRPHGCGPSDLLSTFSSRVRSFCGVGVDTSDDTSEDGVKGATAEDFDRTLRPGLQGEKDADRGSAMMEEDQKEKKEKRKNLRLTFVDRREGRRLLNSKEYLEEAKERFPEIDIQAVDFAGLEMKEQVQVAWETDVLVGVHGAGLTHAMWMVPGAGAMVEILPRRLVYPGFRNLAGLLGMGYFGVHGVEGWEGGDGALGKEELPTGEGRGRASGSGREEERGKEEEERIPAKNTRDWHEEDVFLEKERFMDLLDVAIRSLYGAGGRDLDVN